MKHLLFLWILLAANISSANIQIIMGDAGPSQFTARIVEDMEDPDMGRKIIFTDTLTLAEKEIITNSPINGSETETVSLSISQIQKITLQANGISILKEPLEMFFVVLADGQQERLQLFIPKKPGETKIFDELKTEKDVINNDGFYWESSQDIKSRFRLQRSQGGKVIAFQVDAGKLRNEKNPDEGLRREWVTLYTLSR